MFEDRTYTDQLCADLEAENILANINWKEAAKTSPVENYIKYQKIGQGTFGEVFKVRHKSTKQHYALKRIRMEQEKEGFPITALREIRLLQSLQHENIVCLKDICHSTADEKQKNKPQFYLVFEFCDHDLAGLSQQVSFTDPVKKAIMKQLLTGIYYLHKNNILHRDLKAANILIDKNGVLKIADFGLARRTLKSIRADRPNRYTGRVVTLWYRPPEILLNDRHYGKPVDMWGAGCIMAELWTKYPIMQGDNEINQLKLIINLCGSITPEVWPGVEKLDTFQEACLPLDIRRHVKEKLTTKVNCPQAVDLIDRLLVLDPRKRLNTEEALSHDYFFVDPAPGDLRIFSRSGTCHLEYLSNSSGQNRGQHRNLQMQPSVQHGGQIAPGSGAKMPMGLASGQRHHPYHPHPGRPHPMAAGTGPPHHGHRHFGNQQQQQHHPHHHHHHHHHHSSQQQQQQQQQPRRPDDNMHFDRIY